MWNLWISGFPDSQDFVLPLFSVFFLYFKRIFRLIWTIVNYDCRKLIDKFEKKSEKCFQLFSLRWYFKCNCKYRITLFFSKLLLNVALFHRYNFDAKKSMCVQKAKAFSCFQALLTFWWNSLSFISSGLLLYLANLSSVSAMIECMHNKNHPWS